MLLSQLKNRTLSPQKLSAKILLVAFNLIWVPVTNLLNS